jgi:hypothetical protein
MALERRPGKKPSLEPTMEDKVSSFTPSDGNRGRTRKVFESAPLTNPFDGEFPQKIGITTTHHG